MHKQALVSVSDKRGVVNLCSALVSLGWDIISTGGTARTLQEAGVAVKPVDDVTGFPEILEGRLKTLHPLIHGGILARRDSELHRRQMQEHGIAPIDLVVVNLYPFAETIAREGVTLDEAVEQIDIGGPTMVRAAAKNYHHVGVVVNPDRYEKVIGELKTAGELSESTRFALAVEALQHTARYDTIISSYLVRHLPDPPLFPSQINLPYNLVSELRYGENPHQRAAFYAEPDPACGSIAAARQLKGKQLSFNNLNDLNAAWQLLLEFKQPAAVAVKHTNPCGVGLSGTLSEAFRKAYDADPVSIFGGIVTLNRPVDSETAAMLAEIFLEIVAAPGFSDEAIKILETKKDLRLMEIPVQPVSGGFDLKPVSGGLLLQQQDKLPLTGEGWKTATKRQPTEAEMKDLIFGMKVVRHVKSNAIVLVKDGQTIGIGAGQMGRVGAAEIAIRQAGDKAGGSVMASDAFFPLPDTVELAARAGVTAIAQPGGSLKDKDSIAACDNTGIAMVLTGSRHFKH